MIIIAEKINGTRKAVAKAIEERDAGFIKQLAKDQTEAGSSYIDINAGTHPDREADDMIWLVENVQSATELPICLDSANPQALEAGLEKVDKKPLINSVSGEKNRIEGVLPLALKHGTNLILLALDDTTGIPETSSERMVIIDKLVKMAKDGGLSEDQLFVDPLVTAISTGTNNAMITFDTIKKTKENYPKAYVTSGLSNISFGMPLRKSINRAFLAMCVAAGMDSAIANPNDKELMTTVLAAEMLMGKDRYCMNFNKAYRAGMIGA
jgi:5-methyltetrahydrofolate corrinoid/iron sulfur protein methyltransferase